MARVSCAISGIRFTVSYLESVSVAHTEGYPHPIFALPRASLYPLYTKHCKGELSDTDSYLLFLAFFHSSGQVTWNYPASCNPNEPRTKMMIENNFASLLRVLEQSDLISHPAFDQPSFAVYYDNCSLNHLPNWILAWEKNIKYFYTFKASQLEIEELQKIENKLSYHILSGDKPEKYARVIANWAAKAGNFPEHSRELWKETIRSCFSVTKMFNTPLSLLKEIKEYVELNIEVGSIHFHTLSNVIKEGIANHVDYLGGSSVTPTYILLPNLDTHIGEAAQKGNKELANIVAKAPDKPPKKEDYKSSLDFLKAKLAYRVATNAAAELDIIAAAAEETKRQAKLKEREQELESILAEEEAGLEEDYIKEISGLDSISISDIPNINNEEGI